AGDRNHDGRVTLFEAYNYAYDRTAGYSAENLDRPQHPSFQVDLTGARDMTLARLLRSSTGILFHACPAGLYNVVDIQHGIQIGELHIPQGDEFTLALEPGRYRVLYRPGRGPTKAVDLDLEAAVMTRLPFEAFRVQQAVAGAPKGGSGGALERPLGEADAPAPLPENAAPAMRPARFFGRLGWGAWGGSAFFFDRTLARNLESNGPPDTYFGTTGSFSGSPYKLEFGADFTYALAGEWFLGMRLASAGMQYAMHTHGQEPLDGLSDAERAQYPVNLDWSYDFTDQRIGVFGGRAFPLAPGHSLAAEAGLSILERDAEGSRTLERTFYGTRDSDREQATRRGYRMEGALAYRHVLPFGLFGKSVIMGAKVSPYYTRFSGFHAEKSGMALDADELGCAALVTLQVLGRTAFPVTRSNAGGHL
ncbi:MAG TPA: hypothetical protein VJ385_06700, partial [Fibrobacteria bacterium]|nr:hypothetical protein [Fibrobacteria bacterium]